MRVILLIILFRTVNKVLNCTIVFTIIYKNERDSLPQNLNYVNYSMSFFLLLTTKYDILANVVNQTGSHWKPDIKETMEVNDYHQQFGNQRSKKYIFFNHGSHCLLWYGGRKKNYGSRRLLSTFWLPTYFFFRVQLKKETHTGLAQLKSE